MKPTLAEIRQFQITGKLPQSLIQRRQQAKNPPKEEAETEQSTVETIDPKPTSDSTKAEIIAWLEDHSIDFNARNKKEDLLTLIS